MKTALASPPTRSKRVTLVTAEAAEQGDGHAQYHLGTCYAKGIGIAPDAVEALKWFVKTAEHEEMSYAFADYDLGRLFTESVLMATMPASKPPQLNC